MTDKVIVEAFRESTPSVIPEIFYRESTFLLFPFVFLLVIIGAFPPIIWIPDRTIQE